MPALQIHHPRSIAEATALLASYGGDARVIAGGTALVLMLKHRMVAPPALVNLARIPGLSSVEHRTGEGLILGALGTLREAELSPLVRKHQPVLAETYGKVANVRVRHVATVGGNVCEADYASDPPPVLVALDARFKVSGTHGEREILARSFFVDFYETALEPDEIVTEVVVPDREPTSEAVYLKYVTRSSEDRPCVGVVAALEVNEDGSCRDLRVVVGAVDGKPREIESAEAMARGQHLSDDLVVEIGQAYARAIEPIADLRGSTWYRKEMIAVFVKRAVKQAWGQSSREATGPVLAAAGQGAAT